MSTKQKAYLALAAISLIWGSTWVVMKLAINGIPPFELAAIRHCISGFVFVSFFLFYKNEKLPTKQQFLKILFLGFITFYLANAVSTWSLTYISSGLGALIGALYPLSVVIIEHFFYNNKSINKITIFGITLGILGIGIVFYQNAFSHQSSYYLLGIFLALIAMLSWSIASVLISKKYIQLNSYYSMGWQMLVGFIACTITSCIFEKQISIFQLPVNSLLSLAYLIISGSFIAMILFIYCMKNLPSPIASIYAYINPIVAMIVGAIVLHESLTTEIIVGSLITLAGVFLVNISFKKKSKDEMADIAIEEI